MERACSPHVDANWVGAGKLLQLHQEVMLPISAPLGLQWSLNFPTAADGQGASLCLKGGSDLVQLPGNVPRVRLPGPATCSACLVFRPIPRRHTAVPPDVTRQFPNRRSPPFLTQGGVTST